MDARRAGAAMRALAAMALLLLAVLPSLASATNACQSAGPAYVCAGDFQTGCSSSTGANAYVGSLSPILVANVQGVEYRCSTGEAVTASVYASGNTFAVRWFDGTVCYLEVRAAGQGQQVPCVAGGPPNPGWGSVLP